MVKYTDAQILGMIGAPLLWSDQPRQEAKRRKLAMKLRQEAKRRKLAVTAVTPLTEVVSLLRAALKAGQP